MDAINFQLDLIGYSTKDFAAIHYLHPLYNGQLDFKHVINLINLVIQKLDKY